MLFFFFKQKTAYEMRISDWSSDVCSSDLYQVPRAVQAGNKLINRDHIFLMAGALGTPMTNAVLPEQFTANVPNFAPLSSARSMYEQTKHLKFGTLSSYFGQSRAGLKKSEAGRLGNRCGGTDSS